MRKSRNYIIISTVIVAFLIGTISAAPQASAANPVLSFLQDTVMPKLDAILAAISGIDTTQVGLNPSTQTQIDDIQSRLGTIETQLDEIQSALSAIPIDNDGDGFTNDVDCDDDNNSVNPGAIEIIGDGLDNDCDGTIDPITGTWSILPVIESPCIGGIGTASISEIGITQVGSNYDVVIPINIPALQFTINVEANNIPFSLPDFDIPFVDPMSGSVTGTFTSLSSFDADVSIDGLTLDIQGFPLSCDPVPTTAITGSKLP